jgi:hypothetical protein
MRQFDRTSGGKRPSKPGQTVYLIAPTGQGDPKPVEIRTGITDGRFTAVVGDGLADGATVVVGLVTAKAEASRAPGMPGGPGGGRRF